MTTAPSSPKIIVRSVFKLSSLLFLLLFLITNIQQNVVHSLAISSSSSSSSSSSMPPLSTAAEHIPLANKAMKYFDNSPDPFHAVETSVQMLKNAGFVELDDRVPYRGKVKPGGKYYFTRNKSTIVAFAVGKKFIPGNGGFKVIGCHTDSPNIKVKPRSKRTAAGCIQLGVETYGGGLWHTWFDRDLGISGRVFLRSSTTGKIYSKLIKIDKPIVRIPNLAIHLQSPSEREAFKVNTEDHLSPILAMSIKKALTGNDDDSGESSSSNNDDTNDGSDDDDDDNDKTKEPKNKKSKKDDGWTEYQEPLLLQILSSELGLDDGDDEIIDFELNLFDVQRASIGGGRSEFIHSARLDNLASCFIAVQALIELYNNNNNSDNDNDKDDGFISNDRDISLIALFDHEEVGSESTTGAGSPIMGEAVERICSALLPSDNGGGDGDPSSSSSSFIDMKQSTLRRSFVLSVDQAHAIHPNYASKHEKQHSPKMNNGMVIKRNSNQRYATNGETGLIIREIARKAGITPLPQEFVVRNDCRCGSTIGPIISSTTGIRAIDMGCPQLSMHSIRETMGICDLSNGLNLFKAYFMYFHDVDESINN